MKFEPTRYDLGRRALPRHRRGAARLACSRRSATTTRSCSARSAASRATRTCRPGILERGLLLRLRFELDHYVNLRPSRIFPGVASPLAEPGRRRLRGRPRGHRGPLHRQRRRRSASAPPPRSPPRSASTRRTASSASSATRSPAPSAARARSSPWSTRPTCWSTPARSGARLVDAVVAEFPDVDRRLPARRRGHDLHDHRPGPLRRDRHRQPVRRHHHRPRRRDHRRHRPGRVGQHQPRPHRAVACSSRCTARPPTSPASRRPTRPPPSSRSRCCSTTSATPTRPPPSRQAVIADLAERVPGALAAYPRGRRRDRGARSRLSHGRPRRRCDTDSPADRTPERTWTTVTAHGDQHHPVDHAGRRRPARRDPRQPGLRHPLHRPHVHGRVDARRTAGTTPGSRRTARSRSTRRRPSCTTRRRRSRG